MRVFTTVAVLAFGLQACGGELAHESPFDPFSPATKQAKGEVVGRVLLEGESEHADVEVTLQNDARTYNLSTAADGSLRLTGVVPGEYRLTAQTRYFDPLTRTVTVALGSTHDLGRLTLAARRAEVTGSARAEVYEGEALQTRGGVHVRLERKNSIRALGAAAPAFRMKAGTPAPSFEAISRGDGRFELSGVTPGVYTVLVGASESGGDGGAGVAAGEVTVAGEPVEVEEIVGRPLSGFFVFDGIPLIDDVYVSATGVIDLLLTHNAAASVAIASVPGAGGSCVFGAPAPVAPAMALPIALEGVHTVCVRYFTDDVQTFDAPERTVLVDTTPPAGSLVIDGGAGFVRATDGAVFLTLSAADGLSGVGMMKLANAASEAACAAALDGAIAEPFVTLKSWQLANAGAGVEGDRHVCALFADKAGNWSTAPQAVTVRYDTNSPSATVSLSGLEGVAGRTRNYNVTIGMSGYPADAAEFMIANEPTFTGAPWRSMAATASWVLAPGDGLKTVYVKIRDEAGNESVVYQPTITLDQTAPDVPGITMEDVDGDGFAISGDFVELRWTVPSELDLAGYELQRFIAGGTSGFVTIAELLAGTETYVDAVTETSGFNHFYRIRTLDSLGNASAWSLTVQAYPYQPISTAAWLWLGDRYRYVFPPNPGTFSIRATLSYRDFAGAELGDELPTDVAYWDRPESLNDSFEEQLTLRTVNQDNSLVYLSTFRGQLQQRLPVDAASDNPGITIGPDGSVHLVYEGRERFRHIRFSQGVVVETGEIDTSTNEDNVEITVDSANRAHVAYLKWENAKRELRYATNASGAWVITTLDEGATADYYARIAMGPDDKPHLLYRKSNKLYYAAPATTGEGWETVEVTNTTALTQFAFAMDADGHAHVFLCDPAAYWTNQSGAWVSTSVSDFPDQACTPAIAVDEDGNVHAAWQHRLDAMIRYASSAGGWSKEEVETFTEAKLNNPIVATTVSIAVYDGKPYIAFTDYDNPLGSVHRIAYKSGGTWHAHDVDTIQTDRDGSSIAIDDRGNVYLAYSRSDQVYLYSGFSLVDTRVNVTIPDKSLGSAGIAMAVDSKGRPHIVEQGIDVANLTYRTRVDGAWSNKLLGFPVQAAPAGIAIDDQDRPHIIAETIVGIDFRGKYMLNDNGTWSTVDLGKLRYPSIAADTAGGIHVTYMDMDSPGALRYRYRAPGASSLGAPELAANAESGTAVGDTAGNVHLVYFPWEMPRDRLRYAVKRSGDWAHEAVDDTAKVARFALALDGETPHLLYIDNNTERLYHAVLGPGGWKRTLLAGGVTKVTDNVKQALTLQIDAEGRLYALYYNHTDGGFYFGFNFGGSWSFHKLATGHMAGLAVVDPLGELHFAYQQGASEEFRLRYQTGIFGLLYATTVDRVSPW